MGEQGHNGDTRVTADNRDVLVGRVGSLDLRDESGGTNDVKSGHTEQTLGVVDAFALVDFGTDGNGRVDLISCYQNNAFFCPRRMSYRVRDDQEVGIGCGISSGLCKVSDNRRIGVEEI